MALGDYLDKAKNLFLGRTDDDYEYDDYEYEDEEEYEAEPCLLYTSPSPRD